MDGSPNFEGDDLLALCWRGLNWLGEAKTQLFQVVDLGTENYGLPDMFLPFQVTNSRSTGIS